MPGREDPNGEFSVIARLPKVRVLPFMRRALIGGFRSGQERSER